MFLLLPRFCPHNLSKGWRPLLSYTFQPVFVCSLCIKAYNSYVGGKGLGRRHKVRIRQETRKSRAWW